MLVNRPARVLHVITRLIVGGAQENTLLTVIHQQRSSQMRVTLLCGVDDGPEGNLHEEARAAGVDLVVIPDLVRPISPWRDLKAFITLLQVMRRGRYDIVHTHSSKAGIIGRLAAKVAGVPVIVHTLHSLVFHEYQAAWKNRLYIRLKKMCARVTDQFISVNQKTADGAMAAGIGHPEKHEVIFSGMELAPFLSIRDRLDRASAKRALGIPGDAIVVGKVARMFPLKGHQEFLESAAIVALKDPSIWFLFVGDGVLRESIQGRVAALGIANRCVFAGLVPPSAVPSHLQAMDIVVHTSLREGIARVIPQAHAVGKPVVAYELDGAPEVVHNGVSGYLVKPHDNAGLADRVLELARDPGLRERMGEAGRAFAIENFSAELMARRINEVYARQLRRRNGALAPAESSSVRPDLHVGLTPRI